ncbi:MAG: DUF58 domain-containing protein [Planctomycetes bacterium]|nr:DUF58 domain-containing protein [Planctomycetota bacterium]
MKTLGKYINNAAIGAVGHLELGPKGVVEGSQAGAHKSPFHGFSVEFAGHREYMPGDEIKHIDWVVYYKRDRYMIKQYEAETNMVCQIMLDCSESMNFGSGSQTKLDYAALLAITLTYLVTGARDSVGLAAFDEKIIEYVPPSNNLSSTYKLNKILEELVPSKKTNLSEPILDFANRIGRRQIAVLISDFFCDPEELRKGIARLRFDHHEVVVFQVMDTYELEFPMDGKIKFKGLEGYPELKLSPKALRKAYLAKVEEHNYKLREICEKGNAEYVLADTSKPVQQVLFKYLTSRLSHPVR